MSKYINADRLRAEILFAKSVYDNPKRVVHGVADAYLQDGRAAMCDDILKKIDSLQQERPQDADGKELLYVSNKSYNIGFRDGASSVKPAERSENLTKLLLSELLNAVEQFVEPKPGQRFLTRPSFLAIKNRIKKELQIFDL